jgi:hypothetical protein
VTSRAEPDRRNIRLHVSLALKESNQESRNAGGLDSGNQEREGLSADSLGPDFRRLMLL